MNIRLFGVDQIAPAYLLSGASSVLHAPGTSPVFQQASPQ